MGQDSAARRWFTNSFILDEKDIATQLGASLSHPLKVFNLSQLGLDQDAVLDSLAPHFNNLEWDQYDVKNEQINLLEEVFPEQVERLQNFRVDYLADQASLAELQDLLAVCPAQIAKKIDSILPWRQRALSSFRLRLYGDQWNVELLDNDEFVQRVDEIDPRAIPRTFASCRTELTGNDVFRDLLIRIADLMRELDPHVATLKMSCHQIRVVARRGAPGLPCPEGLHQDGADYVLSGLVIDKKNISGGKSMVLSEDGEMAYLETELEPGQGILHADSVSPYWHYVTPCAFNSSGSDLSGYRDILGFDIHVEKRNGSLSTRGAFQNPDSVEGGIGAFSIPFHREMVADRLRVEPFRQVIQAVCKDKVVVESGTGTGIMSLFAAEAGAKHVYAVEIDPRIAAFAEQTFKNSGLADRITLLRRDIREVEIEDIGGQPADVIIAENLATWLVTEPQLQNMNYLNKFLARPEAVRIPGKMSNSLALVNAQFEFYNYVKLRTYYFEFTGIPTPPLYSEPVAVIEWDFSEINSPVIKKTIGVTATQSGLVNAVRLTSLLYVDEKVLFSHSDTLLPPVVVPLRAAVEVQAGQALVLDISFETLSSWEAFSIAVEVTN